ncbi:MAG: hypothetical protein ACR2GD_04835, partial [Pyrinomonadaceae bacterium]
AEGDEALQRLLIRARAPGGTINVYQLSENADVIEQQFPIAAEQNTETNAARFAEIPRVEKRSAPVANGNGKNKIKEICDSPPSNDFLNLVPPAPAPLPFEFTNRVENRARESQISAEDWQTLLQIVGELLGAVEEVFARANLNFTSAFAKARAEIADDYPFLNPSSGLFYYAGGAAQMNEKTSAKFFAASINESLRRVLDELAGNPELKNVNRAAAHKISLFIERRKSLCDKFFITPQLEKIIGI